MTGVWRRCHRARSVEGDAGKNAATGRDVCLSDARRLLRVPSLEGRRMYREGPVSTK